VVKLGKTFSVFVVLTLLVLLAPAVMLAPGGNVAANSVVQEVEATFTFNETEPGEWWPFVAGSQGIDAAGLCLAQYTRENVVRGVSLPGCGFRNYTAGTGTASGDLTGTIWVSWLTYNFSQKYSRTPLYHDYGVTAHFGWMAGRARFYGGGGNDFTFVFVLDFDSDETMTNADGKGVMLSVVENGTFAGHKIIGDFDVLKSGADYTWDLHLRNYDPSEVFDVGQVNVTGQVLQEPTDVIRFGLDLLSFTVDGPRPTQSVNHTTDFEEITWGREPYKNVTSGYMGTGGLMDLSRNNALYLHIDTVAHPGETWIGIQGTPACNLHIDDSYNQTGDDGSLYGDLWYVLLLEIPFQYLEMVPPPYNYFTQLGYTFTPFGLVNASTDWYSGRENYALAQIDIEATAGTAHQLSRDQSYGLYPHPKVENVIPGSGSPNTTMNVTISGKYFLRAAGAKSGWVPNSGNVDFGPNITVNSYTINTNNPIDNSITASITISPTAGASAEVVNVTSCFNYTSGNGTAPYLSGTGVFNVVAAGSGVEGNATFLRAKAAPDPTWETGLVVRGFVGASKAWERTVTTNDTGVFTITGITPGTYDIGIKNCTTLSKVVYGVTLNSTANVSFGDLLEGDVNNDNKCNILDLSALGSAFGTSPPSNKWADFNRDNKANILDLSTLGGSFGSNGQQPW